MNLRQHAGELAASCELIAAQMNDEIRQAELSASRASAPRTRALYSRLAAARRDSAETLSTKAAVLRRTQRLIDQQAERLVVTRSSSAEPEAPTGIEPV